MYSTSRRVHKYDTLLVESQICGQHAPNEANVGADEINDPRKSGRATSVI